jgi:hypothetical protein
MWTRRLVRKALELKDEELKAFFMRASVEAEVSVAGCKWQGTGQRATRAPCAYRFGLASLPKQEVDRGRDDRDTKYQTEGQLAPGKGEGSIYQL